MDKTSEKGLLVTEHPAYGPALESTDKLRLTKERLQKFYEAWVADAVEANTALGEKLFHAVDPKTLADYNSRTSRPRKNCFVINGPRTDSKKVQDYDIIFGQYEDGASFVQLEAVHKGTRHYTDSPRIDYGYSVTDENATELHGVLAYRLEQIEKSNRDSIPNYELSSLPTIKMIEG